MPNLVTDLKQANAARRKALMQKRSRESLRRRGVQNIFSSHGSDQSRLSNELRRYMLATKGKSVTGEGA